MERVNTCLGATETNKKNILASSITCVKVLFADNVLRLVSAGKLLSVSAKTFRFCSSEKGKYFFRGLNKISKLPNIQK